MHSQFKMIISRQASIYQQFRGIVECFMLKHEINQPGLAHFILLLLHTVLRPLKPNQTNYAHTALCANLSGPTKLIALILLRVHKSTELRQMGRRGAWRGLLLEFKCFFYTQYRTFLLHRKPFQKSLLPCKQTT